MNSFEIVQRHFTKRITELRDLSYQERLTVLNLHSLPYNIAVCHVITLNYKVFNNLTHVGSQ